MEKDQTGDPDQSLDPSLEWERFLSLAREEARTETGKTRIDSLVRQDQWARDVGTARLAQQETQEISWLLDREALWGPLTLLKDPSERLEELARGGILEIADLALLRGWLYAIDSWIQTPKEEVRGDHFRRALSSLGDPFEPLRTLEKVLTPQGELSEKASPRLGGLYSEIRSLKKEISFVLDHLVKTLSLKGILQENFSDVRDGRYVIPVKIASQNDVDGIIYEASASRQTVFVEPREVAQLNNRLRQKQNELLQEIQAILLEVSKRLKPFAGEISASVAILGHWDAVQARARLGRHFGGKTIAVTEERTFLLKQTAHPLLWWSLPTESIIRNDMEFGDPTRTLLLTGPNTGGKTVLLKTLGMAGVCARTGFPFPAAETPTVPFFDAFFVDLGDPQSIQQHLSSFAGHILRFKQTLETVTERSLVLIDELNTATDPEEGAALGRAFLETVMARGAVIIVTTHDPHLKALSLEDQRILNASMAFDEQARTPTYRMVLGVPGRSRALETAERLGLPPDVVTLARSYVSQGHADFERLLSRLEVDARDAAAARKEAVRLKDEAERFKKEWTERTEKSVADLLDKTRTRLRRILEQAQDDVRSSVKKLDEMRSRREVDKARADLNETVRLASSRVETALKEEAPEIVEALEAQSSAAAAEAAASETQLPLVAGEQVRIPKWKNIGTILSIAGNKVKVAMGTLQMTLSLDDIERLTPAEAAKLRPSRPALAKRGFSDVDRPAAPPAQIDLRGVRLEDAMMRLEQYLDQAFRSEAYHEVTVVHGLGTGAIREGTRKLLANLPYVKEFKDGGVGHGGTGATIVEFER